MCCEHRKKFVLIRKTPDFIHERYGLPISESTVRRWASEGIRNIRLQTMRLGGAVVTTEKAIDDFFARLSVTTSEERKEINDQ